MIMQGNLIALNAKLPKIYSEFLDYDDFYKLSKRDNLKDSLSYLKENKFGDLDILSDIYEVESYFRSYMLGEVERLKHFLSSKYRDFIKNYLMESEIKNIKYILRAIKIGKTPNIETLVIKGRNIDFNNVSLSEFVDNLKGTDYYNILKNYVSEDETTLFYMEMNLDKFYYQKLVSSVSKLSKTDKKDFLKTIGVKIDMLNIIWIYRAKKYFKLLPEEIFNFTIFGGTFTSEKLLNFTYLKEEDFIEEIRNTKYAFLFNESDDTDMNKKAERYELLNAKKVFRSSRGIGKLMAFLILLEIEIKDIEILLESARFNLPYEDKLKHLINSKEGSELLGYWENETSQCDGSSWGYGLCHPWYFKYGCHGIRIIWCHC